MKRGFTLIEVMIVVALAGVMTALALPRISEAVIRARGPAEIVRVEAFMMKARNLSRRLNRCVLVERTSTSQMTARTFSDGTAKCPAFAEAVQTVSIKLNADIVRLGDWQNTGDPTKMLLNRTGGTTYAVDAVMDIDLLNTGRKRSVHVLPLLGFVRVQ